MASSSSRYAATSASRGAVGLELVAHDRIGDPDALGLERDRALDRARCDILVELGEVRRERVLVDRRPLVGPRRRRSRSPTATPGSSSSGLRPRRPWRRSRSRCPASSGDTSAVPVAARRPRRGRSARLAQLLLEPLRPPRPRSARRRPRRPPSCRRHLVAGDQVAPATQATAAASASRAPTTSAARRSPRLARGLPSRPGLHHRCRRFAHALQATVRPRPSGRGRGRHARLNK